MSVNRHPLTRAHTQVIACLHLIQRHILLTVICYLTGGFGSKVQQSTNGIAGAVTCRQFQHLPDQHQNDDHCCSLEIDWRRSVCAQQAGRKNTGNQCGDHTEQPGRTNTDGDQRPHVRATVDNRRPAAFQKRPAHPQDDRRTQQHLQPKMQGISRGGHRLQCHSANRAIPRFIPDDLRIHRAGVLRTLRHRLGCCPVAQIILRRIFKPRLTP